MTYGVARVVALGSIVLSACGSSQPAGGDSPEAPIRELTAAGTERDTSKTKRALVSPARLRKALDCPPHSTLIRDLESHFELLDKIEKLPKPPRDTQSKDEIRSINQTSQTRIKIGDAFHDCKATEDFESRELAIERRIDDKDHREVRQVIQLDGRWFAMLAGSAAPGPEPEPTPK
ncbi:MAG: hypothetical protein H0T65_25340 [Deltaproteobacteria bacterium]|nr:hypothetical protein [Deltaproteobacteria bacterium]